MTIPPSELRIESVGTPRDGRQHVGKIDTGVSVTHLPTGLTAVCSHHRSQFKNRETALEMIEWALSVNLEK